MELTGGIATPVELRCWSKITGNQYVGPGPVYAMLKNVTDNTWWNASTALWQANEPANISNCLPTTYVENGDWRFTIPAAATTGKEGKQLRTWILTTKDETTETITSEVRSITLVFSPVTYGTATWSPSAYNLAKYRSELAQAISRDANDEFWTDAELVQYINRAIREIWLCIIRVDPWLYAESTSLTLDPANVIDDVLYTTIPADTYMPLRLVVDKIIYPPMSATEFSFRRGWWTQGNSICTNILPTSSTTATLWFLPECDYLVQDTDADILPDKVIKDWIVPLAKVFATWKEQTAEQDTYLKFVAMVQKYCNRNFPKVAPQHEPQIFNGCYDGFEA